MITFTTQLDINPSYPLMTPYHWEDIIFFDIETTGFSSNTSYLYLIGCMYYKNKTWQITQWLADDLNSEPLILEAFFHTLKSYKRLIHYNGTGFDIPFIQQKCKKLNLDFSFDQIESYDIYKKIQKLKKLLPLPDLKLKTVEKFVGIERIDLFSGEDLIQIYANYLGRLQYEKLLQKKSGMNTSIKSNINYSIDKLNKDDTKNLDSDQLSQILLLHNLVDIKGLLQVGNILYYLDLFESFSSSIMQIREESIITGQGGSNSSTENFSTCLYIESSLPYNLPSPIRLLSPFPEASQRTEYQENHPASFIELVINNDQLTLKIPVFDGVLKYFFENYRDYFYLPLEDTAIHKSVAMYVDKDYKVKAKPTNCYSKKQGRFLPQPQCIMTPEFKFTHTDKITYFEITDKFFTDPILLNDYIKAILQYILNSKATKVLSENESV